MGQDSTGKQTAIGSYIAQATDGATATVNVYQSVLPEPIEESRLIAAQQNLTSLPIANIPEIAPLPPSSRMEFSTNPFFVGRADALKELGHSFKQEPGPVIVASTGLGGIGKTQIASEFVHRYGQFFDGGVFWLNFARPSDVPTGIANCGGAGFLNLCPDFRQRSLEEQICLVLSAWQSPLPRLLVFDNCEDEALLETWRPRTGGCRILITSRRSNWDPVLGIQLLPIKKFTRPESIILLRKFRSDLSADDTDLNSISYELGDHPLALHLAGNFLRTYKYSQSGIPNQYHNQLRQSYLLKHPSLSGEGSIISPTNHEQDIVKTFALSYQQLEINKSVDKIALALLSRIVYFAPGEAIPRNLLLASLHQSQSNSESDFQTEKGLIRLISLGLISQEIEGNVRIHRLLTEFVRYLSNDSKAQASVEETLLDIFRSSHNVIQVNRYVVHLRYIADLAIPRGDQQAVDLCHKFGNFLLESCDYESAKFYLEHAFKIHEALQGQEHPDTALYLNDLGYILHFLGDDKQAGIYLMRSLPLWIEKQDHANLAATLDNLGQIYDSVEYFKAALEIRNEINDFQGAAITLHNLGRLLLQKGDLYAAQEYLERSSEIRNQVYEEPNVHTSASLFSLGYLHHAKGHLSTAQEYIERALEIREKVLGPNHPYTLNALNFLSIVLISKGEAVGAREYIDRIFKATDKDTETDKGIEYLVNALTNFGYCLWMEGDYSQAVQYWSKALDREPLNSIFLNNMGMVMASLGKYDAAHQYYKQALEVQGQLGKNDDELTARIHNNFGVLLRTQGDLKSSRTHLEQALTMRKKILGEMSPDTATTINNFGLLLQAEGNVEEAVIYIENALCIRRQLFGNSQPDVARSLHDLGMLLYAQGRLDEARVKLEQSVEIFSQTLSEHPDAATTLANLGSLAYEQGERAQARGYFESALSIYEQRFGPKHQITESIRDQLSSLRTWRSVLKDIFTLGGKT